MKLIPSWDKGVIVIEPETEFEKIALYKCDIIRLRIEPFSKVCYLKWKKEKQ